MKKLIIALLFLSLITSCKKDKCQNYYPDYVPTNLDDSIDFLNCTWSQELKEKFRKEDEKYAGFEFGMGIRNSWELWKGQNELCKYFADLGIKHPDDMSSIILKSFHRKLNNKKIGLNSQIEFYKEYWKKPNNGFKNGDNSESEPVFDSETDF